MRKLTDIEGEALSKRLAYLTKKKEQAAAKLQKLQEIYDNSVQEIQGFLTTVEAEESVLYGGLGIAYEDWKSEKKAKKNGGSL